MKQSKRIENQEKAQEAYAALVLKITAQLDSLEDALYDNVAPDSVNWGHVGSLEYLFSSLRDLQAHMGIEA